MKDRFKQEQFKRVRAQDETSYICKKLGPLRPYINISVTFLPFREEM